MAVNPGFLPLAGHYQHRADHRRYPGGIGDRLGTHFFVTFFVITDVVEVVGFILAVFFALEDTADIWFSFGAGAQG